MYLIILFFLSFVLAFLEYNISLYIEVVLTLKNV